MLSSSEFESYRTAPTHMRTATRMMTSGESSEPLSGNFARHEPGFSLDFQRTDSHSMTNSARSKGGGRSAAADVPALPFERHPLTQADMVLLALARAAHWTTDKIPYEELVLTAWREFPNAFSLRNHPEHPDASDIHKRIYQSLKPAGLAVVLGNKVFRATDLGLERARSLEEALGKVDPTPLKKARLGRNEEAFLSHAAKSRAYAMWQAGQAGQLIDYDARIFFQFGTSTPFDQRRLRVEFAQTTILKAAELGLPHAAELGRLSEHLATSFRSLLEEI